MTFQKTKATHQVVDEVEPANQVADNCTNQVADSCANQEPDGCAYQ